MGPLKRCIELALGALTLDQDLNIGDALSTPP
jgi:hypothetical protein